MGEQQETDYTTRVIHEVTQEKGGPPVPTARILFLAGTSQCGGRG